MKIEIEIEKCDDCPKCKKYHGSVKQENLTSNEICNIWVCEGSKSRIVSIESPENKGLYLSDGQIREILKKDCPYEDNKKAK